MCCSPVGRLWRPAVCSWDLLHMLGSILDHVRHDPWLQSCAQPTGPPPTGCPSCTGLPEEVAVVKHVLQSNWAAVAFSSLDREATRCWEVYGAPRDSLDSPQARQNTECLDKSLLYKGTLCSCAAQVEQAFVSVWARAGGQGGGAQTPGLAQMQ